MRWSPSVTVAAVVRRNDRYLMVEEQPDGRPVVNQPAGHLESGESLIDAVRREVLEETARRFEPSTLVGIYRWTVPGTDRTYLGFCFSGSVSDAVSGRTLDSDITATHWLTREQIATGELPPRSPLVLRCIDDAANGAAIPLTALGELA
jgi:8-oxo-dGTP pyrophosphatase MutT (NUDIX family)